MRVEDTTPELSTAIAPGVEHKGELGWAELHRRLDASYSALKRRLIPSPEEKLKILCARARSLAAGDRAEATSPHLLIEVVEFVLAGCGKTRRHRSHHWLTPSGLLPGDSSARSDFASIFPASPKHGPRTNR